jgi:hypothetical protein
MDTGPFNPSGARDADMNELRRRRMPGCQNGALFREREFRMVDDILRMLELGIVMQDH